MGLRDLDGFLELDEKATANRSLTPSNLWLLYCSSLVGSKLCERNVWKALWLFIHRNWHVYDDLK